MDDVKRYGLEYSPEEEGDYMAENPNGVWVRYCDYTALRARLEAVEKERDQWQRKHESQLKVDFDLVEKYRRPKSGNFHFPEDVAHIIRRLDAAEAALATARRDAVEALAPFAAFAERYPDANPRIAMTPIHDSQVPVVMADYYRARDIIRALANEAET